MRGAGCLVFCLVIMAFGWLLPLLIVPLLAAVVIFILGAALGWLLWQGWLWLRREA